MPLPIEAIAGICHQANAAYCQFLGDRSQLDWLDASIEQRASAIHGVQQIIDNPEMTPEQSHESWLAEKDAAGWTWGSVKDAEKKTHPCFTAYGNLPEEQRVKDVLFQAVARALLL